MIGNKKQLGDIDMSKFTNAINLLTGKTAKTLLQDFMVARKAKSDIAKLCFTKPEMQYQEPQAVAERRASTKSDTVPFALRKIFQSAEQKKKQLELLGLKDMKIKTSDKTNFNGKVIHTFWIELPTDEGHKYNAKLIAQMVKKDPVRSISYHEKD